MRLTVTSHFRRRGDSGLQTTGLGPAAAGQFQSSAVIDRSSDQRQAKRDIDCLAKTVMFENRQALIMVHGEETIRFIQPDGIEGCVSGQRSFQLQTTVP